MEPLRAPPEGSNKTKIGLKCSKHLLFHSSPTPSSNKTKIGLKSGGEATFWDEEEIPLE